MRKHTKIFSISLAAVAALALLFACSTGTGGGGEKTAKTAGDRDPRTVNSVLFFMRYVPSGGTFIMGEHVEAPTQTVTLTKNFWMGETEVTQGLWEAVVGSWPGTAPSSMYGDGDNKPAYNVNWYDAVAFCNKLTIADDSIADSEQVYYSNATFTTPYTSGTTVYADLSKKGYRLPTEAEWEYAARYIDGTIWNHGNHASGDTEYACYDAASCSHTLASDARIGEYAWYNGNTSPSGSKDVGQKTANALGLRDMSGNVLEWCYDWYEAYRGSSETDPTGPSTGRYRVSRGGNWNNSANNLRCANRNRFLKDLYCIKRLSGAAFFSGNRSGLAPPPPIMAPSSNGCELGHIAPDPAFCLSLSTTFHLCFVLSWVS